MCPKGSAALCVKVRTGANQRIIRRDMVWGLNITVDLLQSHSKIEED